MARVSKIESCMFCGTVPCECNAKPGKRSAPKKAAIPPIVPERKRVNVNLRGELAGMAAAAPVRPTMTSPAPPRAPAPDIAPAAATDEDLVFAEAIRNLDRAGMLSDADREKHLMLLTTSPSAGETLATWKARRRSV